MTHCAKCGTERALNTRCKPCRNAYLRERYAKNPEQTLAITRRSLARDPERANRYRRAWEAKNPEKMCAKALRKIERGDHAKWRAANPEKWALVGRRHDEAVRNAFGDHHTVDDEHALWAMQRGRCAHCGQAKKLTVDHIIPPRNHGGSDSAENLQLLCRSCNSRKRNTPPEPGDVEIVVDMRFTSLAGVA